MSPTPSLLETQPQHTHIADAVASLPEARRDLNDRGNVVTSAFIEGANRYFFDERVTRGGAGWQQWDTSQDASYFGIWVHRDLRQILTFAEGDITVVECPDDATFKAEIESMERCYGEAPPVATGIDEDGSITKYYTGASALRACASPSSSLCSAGAAVARSRRLSPRRSRTSCVVGRAW